MLDTENLHSSPSAAERPEELREHTSCPAAGMLEMLTRPWMLHILWVLSHQGPLRFGALRREVTGISARLLTVRLRTLETEGLVRRKVTPGKVPEVLYSPTDRLADMHEFMGQLDKINAKWKQESQAPPPA